MTDLWLVDGYNVLQAFQKEFKPAKVNSLSQLFHLLTGLLSTGSCRVVVVLDGKGDNHEWRGYESDDFSVWYSQDVTADTFIERYLTENKANAFAMRVATNDRAITQLARGVGAKTMNVKELAIELDRCKKSAGEALLDRRTDSHGFNRPFDDKLNRLGL